MQIFVKLGGRTIPLTVAENEKVEALKQLIEDREGIPSSEQRLYYSTSMLQNSNTLSQSNLTNDCFISLKMTLRGGVQIIVKNIGKGPEIGPLELTLDDTVATIKSKIEELQGIPADEVRLALRGKNLENDASLSSINQLKDKGTITLVMVQKKSPASQAARSTPSTPPVKSEPTPCANGCGFYGFVDYFVSIFIVFFYFFQFFGLAIFFSIFFCIIYFIFHFISLLKFFLFFQDFGNWWLLLKMFQGLRSCR